MRHFVCLDIRMLLRFLHLPAKVVSRMESDTDVVATAIQPLHFETILSAMPKG